MSHTKHSVRPGFRIKGDAEEIAGHLTKLWSDNGEQLTPEIVLEDAQRSRSPFHREFEWSDKKAAREFRLVQARYLIRSVQVTFVEQRPSTPVRAFALIVEQDENVFAPMSHILTDPQLRKQAVDRALRELEQFMQKHQHLSELAELFDQMERLIHKRRRIKGKKRRQKVAV